MMRAFHNINTGRGGGGGGIVQVKHIYPMRVGSDKSYHASVFYRFVVSFYLQIMFEVSWFLGMWQPLLCCRATGYLQNITSQHAITYVVLQLYYKWQTSV